jgi:hypothetical protein
LEAAGPRGRATEDFDALFARLDVDPEGSLDGVRDRPNMPLADEPQRVRADFAKVAAHGLQPRPEEKSVSA